MNEAEYILRVILEARDKMATVLRAARAELRQFGSDAKKAGVDIDGLNSKVSSLTRRLGNMISRFDEAGAAIHRFASQKRDADQLLERNVRLFDSFAGAMRETANAARETTRANESHTRAQRASNNAMRESLSRWQVFRVRVRQAARELTQAGDNIASLDNRLRSVGILLAFTFAQQLIGALVGLGGQFVAVGSSAAAAGGFIAGAFVGGIAQALPAVGLLTAALQRAGAVMDVINQLETTRQQQFVQGAQANERAADSADTVANAQDSVRSALEGVSDAQDAATQASRQHALAVERLRDARAQARRDLEDLILAERRAELAARGAALSQQEAQEALRQATLTGGGLDLQRAELDILDTRVSREEALTRLRRQRVDTRTAVRGGVEGMQEVEDAKRAVEDSRRAMQEADEGIADAERAVQRAERGIARARRNAAEAVEGTQTAALNLQYLLAQLSPAERRLYQAVRRIRGTYEEIFRPITDIVVDSFTRTVNRVERVIRMPGVIRTATDLARSVGQSINRITDALISPRQIAQFSRITEAGRQNLEPLTTIVIRLGRAFTNIAEESGPALAEVIEFIGGLARRFEEFTESGNLEQFFLTGEKHFEQWIELGLAVIQLFMAIAGPGGGAASGLDTITDATNALEGLRQKVLDNADDVQKFFADSQRVLYAIIDVLVALAEEIFKSFDVERVEHFADFLIDVVIPALGMIIRTVGAVTSTIAQFLSLPVISDMAKWGLAVLGLMVTVNSTLGAISYFSRTISHVLEVMGKFSKLTGFDRVWSTMKAAVRDVAGNLRLIVGHFGRMIGRLPGLRRVGGALARWGAPLPALGPGQQTTFVAGPDGTVVPAGRPRPTRRQRAARVGRGIGIGAVGAAAVAGQLGAFDPSQIADLDEIEDQNLKLQNLKNTFDSLVSLDIGGVFQRFDATQHMEEFEEFAATAGDSIERLTKTRNVEGLQEIAKRARDFASEFPQAADALNALADAADGAADKAAKMSETLEDMGRRGRQFVRRLGIEADDIIDPNVVSQLASNFRRMRDAGVTSISDLRENMRFNLDKINEGFQQGSEGWYDSVAKNFGAGIRALKDGMADGTIATDEGMREIRRITRQQMTFVRNNIDNLSTESKEILAGNYVAARRAIERQTGGWRKATGDALRDIRKLMRAELELYGLTPAQARNIAKGNGRGGQYGDVDQNLGREGGAPIRRATGGVLGNWGERGRDLINTWLGRGEVVLNHWQQRALNNMLPGQVTVRNVVERMRGFHAGGFDEPGFAGGYAGRSPTGNRTVPIPGFPGEFIAARVLQDALSLIRRFKLFVTDAFATSGHQGAGHLRHGTAMDVVPGPGGTWDDVDAAVAFARSKGLTVLYNGVANHGRGHHAHIELEGGVIGDIVTNVLRRSLRRLDKLGLEGPDSPLKDIGTAAVENVKGAARRVLRRVDREMGFTPEGFEDRPTREGVLSEQQAMGVIRRAMGIVGVPQSIRARWARMALARAKQESGLDPNIQQQVVDVNTGVDPAVGIMQMIGATFRAHALPGMTNRLNPLHQMVSSFRYMLDRYGGGDWMRALSAMLARAGIGYAQGGEIPGPLGKAIMAIVHGGEWVVNKAQQSRLAQMVGTSVDSLRSMLGFHGQGGEAGFQGGANIEAGEGTILTTARRRRIRRLTQIDLSDELFQSVEGVFGDISDVFRRMRRLRRITDAVRPLVKVMDVLTADGGIFDQLRSAIELRINRITRRRERGRFTVGAGGVVSERRTDLDLANQAVGDLRTERGLLVGERDDIQQALRRVVRRQGRAGLSQRQRRALQQQENRLRQRLEDARNRLAENVSAIFEAQEAALQAAIQAQQDVVDRINRSFEREGALRDFARRTATLFGDEGLLARISAAQRNMLARQANALQARIRGARAVGATELADQLELQIGDLRTQIQEALAQELQDVAQRISDRAGRRIGRLDMAGRLLDATGVVGQVAGTMFGGELLSRSGIFTQRGEALRLQGRELNTLLGRVLREQPQNVQLIRQLTDQIDELNVQIAENTAAAFQARVEEVNRASSFSLNVNDLNRQIIELEGAIAGNTDQAALLASAQNRAAILADQRLQLQQLLEDARAAQNQQQINDLTVALLENQVAILQNTQTINEVNGTITQPQGFSSSAWTLFREAIFNGLGQVLPRYQAGVQAMHPAAAMSATGFYHQNPAETLVGDNGANRGIAQDIDLNFYGYERPLDVTEVSTAVGWATKITK